MVRLLAGLQKGFSIQSVQLELLPSQLIDGLGQKSGLVEGLAARKCDVPSLACISQPGYLLARPGPPLRERMPGVDAAAGAFIGLNSGWIGGYEPVPTAAEQ